MPRVFISYASEQQALAQQLEAELPEKGVKAWRDKTHLHAGERWPKKLGDAIADSDALVLLWSSEANQSDFVELEWNIAVAMKKPVMPCLMDATPLPPTLKPSHRISGHNSTLAADQILAALQGLPPSSAPDQQNKLLNSLATVQAAQPKQVLHQINTIINQPNWSVGGNVYQAQGDIHILSDTDKIKKPESPKLDTWIKWVGLGVASLTFLGLLLDVPTKFMNLMTDKGKSGFQIEQSPSEIRKEPPRHTLPGGREVQPPAEAKSEDKRPDLPPSSQHLISKSKPNNLKLSGIVTDQITGDPVEGASVSIPSLNKQVATNSQGFFTLEVIQENNEKVLMMVQKDRYETYRTKATPGNTNLGFVLRRKS